MKDLAATRATRTVGMTHAGLTRAIRHAEANEKVRRNVATLVDTPAGQEGRPSKSLTFGQLTVRSIGNAYRSQARSSRDDFSAAVCACSSCPASRAVVHAGPGWLLTCIAVIALAACAYVGRPQRAAPLASPPRPGLTQPAESGLRGDLRLWRCRLASCLPAYGILRKELRYAVTVNRVITGLGRSRTTR